jgi:predicted acetyltransferase
MNIQVVDESSVGVLANLLGYYLHDMAEWFRFDANADGSYRYPTAGLWDGDRRVYLAYVDDIPVGFALVDAGDAYVKRPGSKDLHEFFVVRRHRGTGLGRQLAERVWSDHPGPWVVRVFHGNLPALPFWRSVIGTYTDGRYQEEPRRVGDRNWSYFVFDAY